MRGTIPMVGVVAALALALPGCDAPGDGVEDEWAELDGEDEGTPPEPPSADPIAVAVPLVEAAHWRLVEAEDDPLRSERPANVDCPAASWGPELGGLEIQTGTCSYFHASQPGLAAIEPGDAVEVLAFHDQLDAAEPAQGHLAILVDDTVVWQQWVEIPSDAAVMEGRWVADQAWPAGTDIGLHLHNHGYNAWTVLGISVVTGGGPEP